MSTTIFLIRPVTYPVASSYLLDTYTAAAAYSLRQLKTGVTSVVRVRRSGDNAESDFTATEVSDGSLATWVGAGQIGSVVKWYDQSGNGNDAVQTTGGNQPHIVTSGVLETKGSKPSILWDNTNDNLRYSTGSIIGSTDCSVFSVTSCDSLATITRVFSLSLSTDRSYRGTHDTRTTPTRSIIVTNTSGTGYFADLSTAYNDTNQRLLSSFIDASKNISAFDNGNTGGTATYTGTIDNDGLIIGNANTSLSGLGGHFQELILFNTDESANRTAIESDINTYYSIY